MWNPFSNSHASVGPAYRPGPNLDPMLRPTPDEPARESLPLPAPAVGTMIKPQIAERWYQSVSRDLRPEYLEAVLDHAITGAISEQFRLFEEMEEKWIELRVALFKHKVKTCRRPARIVPPDHPFSPGLAKKKCDFANAVWGGIRDWHRTKFHALDMVGKGLSLHEIDWAVRDLGGRQSVVIHQMPWVNYRHLVYWPDSPDLQLIPNLLVYNRIAIPDKKFVLFEHFSKSGHAARGALLRPMAWAFMIVLFAMKDWSSLAETFGVDIAWAFHRMGTGGKGGASQDEINKILLHLSRIAVKAGVFPEGTDIHVERAASGSGGPPQEAIIRYYSNLALQLFLGSTLGTEAGKKGARALGEVHVAETDEVVDWTAMCFCEALNNSALRWLMEFNFAEPGDNPRLELPGANRKDLAALADILKVLVGIGVQVPERWAHEEFDVPQPAGAEPLLRNMEGVGRGAGSVGSETAGVECANGGIDHPARSNADTPGAPRSPFHAQRLAAAARDGRFVITRQQAEEALAAVRQQAVRDGRDAGAFDRIAAPVRELIARRSDPHDALAQLRSAADQIEPKRLDGVKERVFTLADLLGRAAIGGESAEFGASGVKR